MTNADYVWANIGPDAWLLVDGPSTATSGVIRAYLIGIEPDDWLWRGIGGEGRATSLDQAMLETQLSVMLAMGVTVEELTGTYDEPDGSDDSEGPDGPEELDGPEGFDVPDGSAEPYDADDLDDLIDDLLNPDK